MLVINHATIRRHGQCLLDNVSAQVGDGQFVVVIGPNGAGKSSLLHTISGDLVLDEGTITLDGKALDAMGLQARARCVGFLPQASTLAFPFTAGEVVALGRSPHATGREIDAGVVSAACRVADVTHLQDRAYTRLSGGEKQRVQLARVLAQIWRAEDADSRLLLLDEPVAALDMGHQQQLMRAICRLAQAGVAIVMVLHDISLAARYADRLLALRDGRVVACGTPSEVVTPATIDALFDIQARVIQHPDSGTPVVLPG